LKPTQKLTETGTTIIDEIKRILISVVSIYADEEVFLEQIFLERVNLAHDD